jgi:hypothetical protein
MRNDAFISKDSPPPIVLLGNSESMNPANKMMANLLKHNALTRRVSFSLGLILFALASAAPIVAYGQLELITNREAQVVFAGAARNISVAFLNPGGQDFAGEIRTRIFQTSSATAVLTSESPWRLMQVPAGETVLASAPLDFPSVRSETKFLVQWLENTNRIIGKTEVLVYPTNLLAELKPMAGDGGPGVFDPQNQLKPELKQLKIEFVNLENSDFEDFSGRLAIIGPFQSKAQMRDGLADQIKALAKKGAAVVWLRPSRARGEKLRPSFYSVAAGTNTVVVAQADLVSDLPDNPQAQLNLIELCRRALNSEPERFSWNSTQRRKEAKAQSGGGKFLNEADVAGDKHLVRSESRAKMNEIVAPSRPGVLALKGFGMVQAETFSLTDSAFSFNQP